MPRSTLPAATKPDRPWSPDADSHEGRSPTIVPLRGRGLRFVLVNELMNRSSMTVSEMVMIVQDHGHVLAGRASKVISDALRWEIARGRVVRTGRGVYRYHQAPPTTARRIRRFAEVCHHWIVAVTRKIEPRPTPQNPRAHPRLPPQDPTRAPWADLGWLWTT